MVTHVLRCLCCMIWRSASAGTFSNADSFRRAKNESPFPIIAHYYGKLTVVGGGRKLRSFFPLSRRGGLRALKKGAGRGGSHFWQERWELLNLDRERKASPASPPIFFPPTVLWIPKRQPRRNISIQKVVNSHSPNYKVPQYFPQNKKAFNSGLTKGRTEQQFLARRKFPLLLYYLSPLPLLSRAEEAESPLGNLERRTGCFGRREGGREGATRGWRYCSTFAKKHAKKFFQKNEQIIINNYFNDFFANMFLHLWQMWCCALFEILFFRNVYWTKKYIPNISLQLYKVYGKCGVVHPSVRWATQKATPPPPSPPLQSSASLAPPLPSFSKESLLRPNRAFTAPIINLPTRAH